jgi:hypothetical protein
MLRACPCAHATQAHKHPTTLAHTRQVSIVCGRILFVHFPLPVSFFPNAGALIYTGVREGHLGMV